MYTKFPKTWRGFTYCTSGDEERICQNKVVYGKPNHHLLCCHFENRVKTIFFLNKLHLSVTNDFFLFY
ncbi:unnamed protein product [Tenebrio molitor]|nr:unnamed protein product [Tenebrio molitor]